MLDLHDDDTKVVAQATWDICEFLLDLHEQGRLDTGFGPLDEDLPYHAPCQLRSHGIGLPGARPVRARARACGPTDMDHDCCGIAGTYGLKKEKYDIAMDVGAPLFEKVKATGAPTAAVRLRDLPLADRVRDRRPHPPPGRDPRSTRTRRRRGGRLTPRGTRRTARRSWRRRPRTAARSLVVGAGAVGSFLGVGAGGRRWRDARCSAPSAATRGRATRRSLVEDPTGPHVARRGGRPTRSPMRPAPDLVIVAVKAFDLDAALETARRWPDAAVLTAQNGVGAEAVADAWIPYPPRCSPHR